MTTRSKQVRALALALLFVGTIACLVLFRPASTSSEPVTASPPPSVDEILWYLPEHTYVVNVVRESFAIPTVTPETTQPSGFATFLQLWVLGPTGDVDRTEKLSKLLIGRRVTLAVEGGCRNPTWSARHASPEDPFGMVPFDACFFVYFEDPLDPVIAAVRDLAVMTETIEGQTVFVLNHSPERGMPHIYKVFPHGRCMITATDIETLRDVLGRMKSRAASRALPESLPEWKHVKRDAAYWGLHHLRDQIDETVTPRRDSRGDEYVSSRGMTSSLDEFDSETVSVLYHGESEKLETGLRHYETLLPGTTGTSGESLCKVTVLSPDLVEMAVRVVGDDTVRSYSVLVLLMIMGHMVII